MYDEVGGKVKTSAPRDYNIKLEVCFFYSMSVKFRDLAEPYLRKLSISNLVAALIPRYSF